MTHLRRPIYAIELTHEGDATRKAIKWTFHEKEFGGTFGAAALGKDTLYALGNSGILVCLDLATGKEIWRSDLDEDSKRFVSPVVYQGGVLVGVGKKLFRFANSRKRKLLGVYELPEMIVSTPAVANGLVYVATNKHVYCLKLK